MANHEDSLKVLIQQFNLERERIEKMQQLNNLIISQLKEIIAKQNELIIESNSANERFQTLTENTLTLTSLTRKRDENFGRFLREIEIIIQFMMEKISESNSNNKEYLMGELNARLGEKRSEHFLKIV
jgi:hypothetical protein